MTTREKLLDLFESHRGVFFSGEELARQLELSRAAVWKAVSALREQGYPITAAPNRGYCLSNDTDILSVPGVEKYLTCSGLRLRVLETAGSTNTLLQEEARQGAPEGTVLAALCQEAGRGRRGRSFYSPRDTGVYWSILLRPRTLAGQEALTLTTMAAAAMCGALEELTGEAPGIKWVNDIYMHGKKVCGILTEGSFDLESGLLEHAVLGVGVNLYPPSGGFPPELEDLAGSVLTEPGQDRKNRLLAAFLNRFMAYYRGTSREDPVELYRLRSLAPGREITVLGPRGPEPALALEVDRQCRLRVRYPDGREEALSWGEIRIRL